MKDNFLSALAITLKEEGGKSDNPHDPGGRTNEGVTQREYDAYRHHKGLPLMDVYLMTNHERNDIYRHGYWDLIKGDVLPKGVDLSVFDAAVNSGPARALHWYRQATGVDADAIISHYANIRLQFLRDLSTWRWFGPGWRRRVLTIKAQSLKMAQG